MAYTNSALKSRCPNPNREQFQFLHRGKWLGFVSGVCSVVCKRSIEMVQSTTESSHGGDHCYGFQLDCIVGFNCTLTHTKGALALLSAMYAMYAMYVCTVLIQLLNTVLVKCLSY